MLEIELHELGVIARRPEPDSGLDQRLQELALDALALGQAAHARRAFFLQSWLGWEAGAIHDAQRFTLEAERCSRLAGPGERVRALADSALCLALLERDLTEAQAFVLEAEALIAGGEQEVACVPYARGMLEL